MSFNNKSLRKYLQRASLYVLFLFYQFYASYRQAKRSLGPNCSLVQWPNMIYCILRHSVSFQCSHTDAQETLASLLGLVKGFCALKLFGRKRDFSLAQIFPENVLFSPALNHLACVTSKLLSVFISSTTTYSWAANNFQANSPVYDTGYNRAVSLRFHGCLDSYNFF